VLVTGIEAVNKGRQEQETAMATLRIEHAINDYQTWQQAFDGFAEARVAAGVRAFTIRQPADDPKYLTLDLEFDTARQAEAFAGFLRQRVWSSPASSPGLAGAPHTQILELRRSEDSHHPSGLMRA
jgi:hypothetical protein